MKQTVLFFASICLISCKKDGLTKKEIKQIRKYTAAMSGLKTWEGSVYSGYSGAIFHDFFDTVRIIAVNDTQIIGPMKDTLTFKVDNAMTSTAVFAYSYKDSYRSAIDTIFFNYHGNTIVSKGHGTGKYSGSYDIRTLPSDAGSTYTSEIAGITTLSGFIYDTTFYPPPTKDSMYSVSAPSPFIRIDDRIIKYNADFLSVGDSYLHLRSKDENQKKVVYETYHNEGYHLLKSTLTFNYANNTCVFEQISKSSPPYKDRYLKLQ